METEDADPEMTSSDRFALGVRKITGDQQYVALNVVLLNQFFNSFLVFYHRLKLMAVAIMLNLRKRAVSL